MRHAIPAIVMLLVPQIGNTQSLVAVDPDAARHTMVRAAGMPLNDGTLPPGMLTVRVVRGAFTANLPGVTVAAEINGGKIETASTGGDGRAQFAHLPVGAQVKVSATVDNQQLTSDVFALPAESGVRILLVLDDGSAGAPAQSAGTILNAAPPDQEQPTAAIDTAPRRRGPSTGVLAIRIFFTVATLAAFAFVLFRQSAPRRRSGTS
jgi:hypothetical protein